jgi:hypothetical protein
MGLDTFATRSPNDIVLSPQDIQAFAEADIQLCGGIFSGDAGSFRGKVYDDLVVRITGESLYRTWIEPETVKEMYRALENCDPEGVIHDNREQFYRDYYPEEIIELRKFFAICAKHGLGLVSSW